MTVDHVALALARIPEQFKSSAKYNALVTLLTAPAQDLEAALQDLLLLRNVDTATGVYLNAIGLIIGQERVNVTDDNLYRRYIRARIATNRSKGTVAELINVAHLIIDNPAHTVVVDQQGIASVVVRIPFVDTDDAVAAILISFLRDVVAGGVRVLLEAVTDPLGNPITDVFAFGNVAHLSSGIGAGTTQIPVVSGDLATFPDAGTIIVDEGVTGSQETLTYTHKVGDVLFTSAPANAHSSTATVSLNSGTTLGAGFDNDLSPSTIGSMADVRE